MSRMMLCVLGPANVESLARLRDRYRLRRAPRVTQPSVLLKSVLDGELDTLFADEDVTDAWRIAEAALEAVRARGIEGGVNPGDQRAIFHLVAGWELRKVLEIGTHIGHSTAAIGLAHRTMVPGGRVITVDVREVNDPVGPWSKVGASAPPKSVLEALGCGDAVDFITVDSIEYLKSTEERFDLIFLDGLHKADRVYQEIALALRLVNPGGLVLLHDYFPDEQALWPDGKVITGPVMAVERLRREGGRWDVYPLGALPWPTKQGSRVTSLAIICDLAVSTATGPSARAHETKCR